jgi:hypothetical protein
VDAISAYGAGFGDVYNTNFKDSKSSKAIFAVELKTGMWGTQVLVHG